MIVGFDTFKDEEVVVVFNRGDEQGRATSDVRTVLRGWSDWGILLQNYHRESGQETSLQFVPHGGYQSVVLLADQGSASPAL
jgi:hypothetical protein